MKFVGKTTGISWANKTFNGWVGCTKVNELCTNCYAERDNKFRKWNGGTWGVGAPRHLTSVSNWRQVFDWDLEAGETRQRFRVFGFSLADWADEVGPEWPADRIIPVRDYTSKKLEEYKAYRRMVGDVDARDVFMKYVVRETRNLDWLLLTKRYEFAAKYLRQLWDASPWGNVWVIYSAGTQDTLDEAMDSLKTVHAVVRGISAEPLLGSTDFSMHLEALDWVIAGGESGTKAREMKASWERVIREQCGAAGVAYFLKQLGSEWMGTHWPHKWDDPGTWPTGMNVQQFPTSGLSTVLMPDGKIRSIEQLERRIAPQSQSTVFDLDQGFDQ